MNHRAIFSPPITSVFFSLSHSISLSLSLSPPFPYSLFCLRIIYSNCPSQNSAAIWSP